MIITKYLVFLYIGGTFLFNARQDSCPTPTDLPYDKFELAIQLIKEYEGWHSAKHYPYVGYGHKVHPNENLTANITKVQGDSLLRKDLLRKCAAFRGFGKDSLLLGVLAYNVGEYRLLGSGKIPKSKLIEKLENRDRNIYQEYISYRKYKGKVIPSIERRRIREFELLYEK